MDQITNSQPRQFIIKDSGERTKFESGMVRDVTTDKTNVALVFDGPMFWRWAVHLSKGAVKYAKRNWMKANGEAELERFKESASRHFMQWYRGDVDEDHAAAVLFNINGAEYVKDRLKIEKPTPEVEVGSVHPLANAALAMGWGDRMPISPEPPYVTGSLFSTMPVAESPRVGKPAEDKHSRYQP